MVNASVYAVYDDLLEILLQENATGVINETVFTEGMTSLDLSLSESITAVDFALNQNSLCQDLFDQVRGYPDHRCRRWARGWFRRSILR